MESFDMIINLLSEQFVGVMQQDYDYYKNYKFVLSNEQQFNNRNEKGNIDPNSIYIIVRFQAATLTYGLKVIPFTMDVFSIANNIEPSQRLLFDYAQKYNLNNIVYKENGLITQTYSTPTIVNNFNQVGKDFRSMFMMGGTILIGENTSNIEYMEIDINGEKVKLEPLSIAEDFSIQLDTQATYNSHNITTSKAKIGTKTFNIVLYKQNNAFFKLIKAIEFELFDIAPKGVNTEFDFTFKYIGDDTKYTKTFHLVNHTSQQNVGEMAVSNLTFTR